MLEESLTIHIEGLRSKIKHLESLYPDGHGSARGNVQDGILIEFYELANLLEIDESNKTVVREFLSQLPALTIRYLRNIQGFTDTSLEIDEAPILFDDLLRHYVR